jgi:hypothetical protein
MRRLTALAAVLPLVAAAGALAQGPAYNRSLRASDLAVEPSPAGAGWRVTGALHIDGDGSQSGDVGCVVRAFAGGAPVGQPFEIAASISGGGASCGQFCFSCRMNGGLCFDFRYLCICWGSRNDGSPAGDLFAIDLPEVHEGEIVTLRVEAAPGALPELVLADDEASIRVGAPPHCRGDFNADGTLNSQDFFAFLTSFFQGSPDADFNADGAVGSQDFFDFLGAFFAGC